MYSRSFSLPLLGLFFLAGSARAATVPDHPWCGTQRPGVAEMAARTAIHRDQQRRLETERMKGMRADSLPEAARVGGVAVLVDDGSIVIQPNQLDLEGFGVQYVPHKKGGFVVSPSSDPVLAEIGNRLDLTDDDAREIKFPKGFRFRFYKKIYTKMFVHSDGNLTFKAPDAASRERNLFRLLSEPPRIAPLFADLDPSAAVDGGGVYVLTSKAKIVVTWLDVPQFGTTNRNTFQAVLYPNGRITLAFGGLAAQEAVVGVAPGLGGQVRLLDYTAELPTGALNAAIAERFAASQDFDHLAIAQAFFREFADDYDHLVVFLDFPQTLGGGAFAFHSSVKNEIQGLGVGVFDGSAAAGSRGRLRSFVQMGSLSRYPDDPNRDFLGTNNTLDLLGHETGHRWLAFFGFADENGQTSNALLGRDNGHWSFCHNSLASDMEGNLLREDGGNRFTAIEATERFSPLDQYAMGLIPAEDVPPFFYVDGCANRAAAPQTGAVIQGRRVDVTIDQIIAAEGPRVPAANKSPHSFNMAFILVGEAGRFPSEASIAKVDRFRAAWELYFPQATDGNAAVSTALKLKR